MRPIGGLIVGYTGDKHGRKRALARALLFMAVPTTVMGCLPTYSTVGWLAPLLLALCRLCQGISVGGQLPASLVYTVEPRPVEHWGFYGSLPMVAANTGSLLGNLCGAFLRQAMSEDDLREYGWRIPFLSGIIIAFVGLYLRFYGEEMHPNENVYDHNDSSRISSPIVAAFGSHNHRALFSSSLTPMLWAGGFYLSFVWMAIFMAELLDPPVENAFWINAAALFLSMTFMLPVAGAISDRLGRTKTMSVAATGLILGGPILVVIIAQAKPFWVFLAQVALGLLLSFFGAPMCAWLVEHYPADVRLTSASWGYDIAHAIGGGLSPLVATALNKRVGEKAPGLLYPLLGLMSVLGLFLMRGRKASKESDTAEAPKLRTKNSANDAEEAAVPKETELPSIS